MFKELRKGNKKLKKAQKAIDEALDAGVSIYDKNINESVNDLFSNAANESIAE